MGDFEYVQYVFCNDRECRMSLMLFVGVDVAIKCCFFCDTLFIETEFVIVFIKSVKLRHVDIWVYNKIW